VLLVNVLCEFRMVNYFIPKALAQFVRKAIESYDPSRVPVYEFKD
jgi:hypothetical protein